MWLPPRSGARCSGTASTTSRFLFAWINRLPPMASAFSRQSTPSRRRRSLNGEPLCLSGAGWLLSQASREQGHLRAILGAELPVQAGDVVLDRSLGDGETGRYLEVVVAR